jgi:hypothetical protein
MPIPESQLETWSHQGAVTTAKSTHESIRTALAAAASPIRGKDYEIYLQGSYKNDTNIRGDSDVDVVVQLNSTFGYDISGLSIDQVQLFRRAYPGVAEYQWNHFRADVLAALRSYYGAGAVREGNKSLKLAGGSGRLPADIIPAIHFRKYTYFYGASACAYIDGIQFESRADGRTIVNFPKPHYENGVSKHSARRTNGWYKPTVRVFKSARTYLVNRNSIPDDLAPSYLLESLLYNVPDEKFGGSLQDTFIAAFNWLWSVARAESLICQNEQLKLFGDTPEQWNARKAKQLLDALRELWENW